MVNCRRLRGRKMRIDAWRDDVSAFGTGVKSGSC